MISARRAGRSGHHTCPGLPSAGRQRVSSGRHCPDHSSQSLMVDEIGCLPIRSSILQSQAHDKQCVVSVPIGVSRRQTEHRWEHVAQARTSHRRHVRNRSRSKNLPILRQHKPQWRTLEPDMGCTVYHTKVFAVLLDVRRPVRSEYSTCNRNTGCSKPPRTSGFLFLWQQSAPRMHVHITIDLPTVTCLCATQLRARSGLFHAAVACVGNGTIAVRRRLRSGHARRVNVRNTCKETANLRPSVCVRRATGSRFFAWW